MIQSEETEKKQQKEKSKKKFSLSYAKATSIQNKIQLAMMEVVAIAMLILGIVSIYLNYSSTTTTVEDSLNAVSAVAAERVEWEITSYKNIVQELGRTARLANDDYSIEEKQSIIDEKVKAYGLVRGKLLNTKGIAIIDGSDYSDREYFKQALAGNVYLSDPLISKVDGSLMLIASAPVWEKGIPDTKVVGVVYLALPADTLTNMVKSIHISKNSGAFMLNNEGNTIAHTVPGKVEIQENVIELAKTDSSLKGLAKIDERMIAGEDGIGSYTYGGDVKYVSYSPVYGTNGWSLGITAPKMDFFGSTILGIVITILVMIAFIILSAFIAIRIGKGIGQPIRLCVERLLLLIKGDLHSDIPEIKSNDETKILSDATTSIVENLNMIIEDIKYVLSFMSQGDFTVMLAIMRILSYLFVI